jgi:hypothetical protein
MLSIDQQPGYGPTSTITKPSPVRRRWGRIVGLLAAGAVLGAALTVGVAIAITSGAPAHFTYGAGGQIPEFYPTSAGCVLGRIVAGRSFPSSASVTCDQPHDAELFIALKPFESSAKLPYPGEQQLADYGQYACQLEFGSAVVGGDDKAGLDVVVLIPSEQQFSTASTSGYFSRDVMCLLQARDGSQLTGARLVP